MNIQLAGMIGAQEIIVILLVVLIFFGGKKIPELCAAWERSERV
jgi:Sec-independent protein translocase protein TatA